MDEENLPTIEQVKQRLAAARNNPRPWLTPEAMRVASMMPVELMGSLVYDPNDTEEEG